MVHGTTYQRMSEHVRPPDEVGALVDGFRTLAGTSSGGEGRSGGRCSPGARSWRGSCECADDDRGAGEVPRRAADLIIPEGGNSAVAIALIITKLKSLL